MLANRRSNGISGELAATGARPDEKYQYTPPTAPITAKTIPNRIPLIMQRSVCIFPAYLKDTLTPRSLGYPGVCIRSIPSGFRKFLQTQFLRNHFLSPIVIVMLTIRL